MDLALPAVAATLSMEHIVTKRAATLALLSS